jgi:hypothetical protein
MISSRPEDSNSCTLLRPDQRYSRLKKIEAGKMVCIEDIDVPRDSRYCHNRDAIDREKREHTASIAPEVSMRLDPTKVRQVLRSLEQCPSPLKVTCLNVNFTHNGVGG